MYMCIFSYVSPFYETSLGIIFECLGQVLLSPRFLEKKAGIMWYGPSGGPSVCPSPQNVVGHNSS